jgi:hypothetical protein
MAPSRPSGAAKKKPANQKGGQQRGRDRGGGQSHLPRNPLDLAANQHCQTLLSPKSSAKTVDGWLPGGPVASFLDEKWQQLQRQKMVRGADLVGARDRLSRVLDALQRENAAAQSRGTESDGWRARSQPSLRGALATKQSRLPPRMDLWIASAFAKASADKSLRSQ